MIAFLSIINHQQRPLPQTQDPSSQAGTLKAEGPVFSVRLLPAVRTQLFLYLILELTFKIIKIFKMRQEKTMIIQCIYMCMFFICQNLFISSISCAVGLGDNMSPGIDEKTEDHNGE